MPTRHMVICLLALGFCGCASLPQEVLLVVESTPPGSDVTSSTGWSCKTPCERYVPTGSSLNLDLELQGHESQQKSVNVRSHAHSKIGTYVGVGVGAFAGVAAAELGAVTANFVVAVFEVALGQDPSNDIKASTGDKLRGAVLGACVYGAIGFGIDRLIDSRRFNAPQKVMVTMQESSGSADGAADAVEN